MADLYVRLAYDEYKELERQLRQGFGDLERTHMTQDQQYYHKSIRLKIGELVLEFHGPAVKSGHEV